MTPEQALALARERAAAARARGAYAPDPRGLVVEPADRPGVDQLLEWALLEPDAAQVRSTRRHGRPITAVKQLLLRALRQYHGQLLAEQTRMNLHLVLRVAELEERLRRAEGERR